MPHTQNFVDDKRKFLWIRLGENLNKKTECRLNSCVCRKNSVIIVYRIDNLTITISSFRMSITISRKVPLEANSLQMPSRT